MKVTHTQIPEVVILEPQVFRDERGFFLESYNRQKYREAGIELEFVQDNHSRSQRGTIRGLHAQINRPQGKLIRVSAGEIFDVAVDVRRGSPTFGQWVGAWLTADNFRQMYVPPGFVHGFCVTSDFAEVQYKCTDFYDPTSEISVLWNDKEIGIDWPLDEIAEPILSKKDLVAKPLQQLMDVLPWFENNGTSGNNGKDGIVF
ncbi:MAG: dTDP-4-dehydrorhamnose 3,5-epimerase [Acidobacteria bacterium]|nr:dTDP-4-dehydrorhamnose 3,5-epimerase [Acidobacteriota bacterium]